MVKSVLFACNMNSVRSPMAAAMLRADAGARLHVDSAGVYEGGPDPFIDGVLREVGVALGEFEPKAMADVALGRFDLAIVLTAEAAEEARKYLPREKIEFWSIDNPTDIRGGRDELLAAYRAVRDDLKARIEKRFPEIYA
jgi:protein-tyrosine-phosphatase